jgi:hypothetical protein
MSRNDTLLARPARLRQIRERARWRASQLRAATAQEEQVVLDHARRHLPDIAGHPGLPRYVHAKVAPHALDLPVDWPQWILKQVATFFSSSGWRAEGARDVRKLSVDRCRQLLRGLADQYTDDEILFLRDQLYRLAATATPRIDQGEHS